jgi:hypothetical protein
MAISDRTRVDVSGFSSGMYLVKVNTGKGVLTEKFVKE